MNSQRSSVSSPYWILALIGLIMAFALVMVNLAEAQNPPPNPVTEIIVDPISVVPDADKKNDGFCTLREAVIAANDKTTKGKPGECKVPLDAQKNVIVDSEGYIVIRVPTGVYTLTRADNGAEDSSNTGDLDVKVPIRIVSYGAGELVIEGAANASGTPIFTDRLFHIIGPNGKLAMEGVTLRRGNAKQYGGAIYVGSGAQLALYNSTLINNIAGTSGGAIYNAGQATVNYSTFKGNSAPSGSGTAINNSVPVINFNLNNSYFDGGSCAGLYTSVGSSNVSSVSSSGCNAVTDSAGGLSVIKTDGAGAATFYGFLGTSNSDAINAGINTGPNALCPAKDQIFTTRPQGSGCDVGAHERVVVNQAPVAGTKNVAVDEDSTAADSANTFSVSDVAYDPESVPLTLSAVGTASNGTASVANANTLEITYVPNANYDGSDSFTYTVCDAVQCTDGTVNVTVNGDGYIEVTNNLDSGAGSLRNAVTVEAPANPGDTIIFAIDPSDACTPAIINLQSSLVINTEVTIDGALKDDGTLCTTSLLHITLTDTGAGDSFDGIVIDDQAVGTELYHLVIDSFGGNGVTVEGTGVPSVGVSNIIDGSYISNNGANGVVLGSSSAEADGNLVSDNVITGNCGSGVVIYGLTADDVLPSLPDVIEGNTIEGNTISGNGWCVQPPESEINDGVTVVEGLNNEIVDNTIYSNAGQGVDLGADGPTPNDPEDPDEGANYEQNYPLIWPAITTGAVGGLLNSLPNNDYTLELWTTDACDTTTGAVTGTPVALDFTYLQTETTPEGEITTGSDGNVTWAVTVNDPPLTTGHYVFGTATDESGNTSEYSPCVQIVDENIIWFWAQLVDFGVGGTTASALSDNAVNTLEEGDFDLFAEITNQGLDQFGESKWYVIPKEIIKPDTTLTVELSDLPANYDLLLFTDIYAEYLQLLEGDVDLDLMGADTPTEMFAAPAWAAPAWAAPAWADDALADDEMAAPAWAPETLAAPAWATSSYAAPAWAAPAWAAPAWAAPAWAPDIALNPALAGEAYAGAQLSALVGVSALDGLAQERIVHHTFGYSGDMYIRVAGRNGAYAPASPFTLQIGVTEGQCAALAFEDFQVSPTTLAAPANNTETLILIDEARMRDQYPGDDDPTDAYPDNVAKLRAKLDEFAAVTDGVVVDVDLDPQVQSANSDADANVGCVAAKNAVAKSVREIVRAYRDTNPIKYLLIVGNDEAIPNFRHEDKSPLGPEMDYFPPVENDPLTPSYAQLAGNYFQSLDDYAASVNDEEILGYKGDTLPLIEIAPARVVETPDEITAVLQAYLDLGAPYTISLDSTDIGLAVGYDFMADTAEAISDVLGGTGDYPSTAGGLIMTELISEDWDANDMVGVLSDTANDPMVAYVGGHYSANSGVAADYVTQFYPQQVIDSQQDFANNLYMGNGCHMGYNLVLAHNDIDPFGNVVTQQPDWPQAFNGRGATLITGTGYQYGDTDFIQYNELVYLEIAKALRNGTAGGSISIGDAFVQAKHAYLDQVPVMRGIHHKSLLQTTIFGLPMLTFDLPGSQVPANNYPSVFDGGGSPTLATVNPGGQLGLATYEFTRYYTNGGIPGPLSWQPVTLTNTDTGQDVSAPYLVGPTGLVQSNIGEPIVPRDAFSVTPGGAFSNHVLRGVGFRGGSYVDYKRGDEADQSTWDYTLTGLAATELAGAKFDFLSGIFTPSATWNVNRFDALTTTNGDTIMHVLAAQLKAELPTPPDTTLRQYSDLSYKLFFSDQTEPEGENLPALAGAPSIIKVEGFVETDGSVTFKVWSLAAPSAGIQEVWITRTTLNAPTLGGTPGAWVSDDLVQNAGDLSLWTKNVPAAQLPADLSTVRFMAQACTGTAVCALEDNFGRYYIPGQDGAATATEITGFSVTPSTAAVGEEVTFTATLSEAGGPGIAGLPVFFSVGSQTAFAATQAGGVAQVTVPILTAPLLENPSSVYDPNEAPIFKPYQVNAFFPGNAQYAQSAAAPPQELTVTKQDTTLTWVPGDTPISSSDPYDFVVQLMTDPSPGNDPIALAEKSVVFKLVVGPTTTIYKSVITDQDGIARLGEVDLGGALIATVSAEFSGNASYYGSTTSANSTLSAIEVVAIANYNGPGYEDDEILETIWPTNNQPIPIELRLADGNHTPIGYPYTFDKISQDEPIKQGPDAAILPGCTEAWVLAQRDGKGNGRVYQIEYTVDVSGSLIHGIFLIATLPHDQSGDTEAIIDSPWHTSATCSP